MMTAYSKVWIEPRIVFASRPLRPLFTLMFAMRADEELDQNDYDLRFSSVTRSFSSAKSKIRTWRKHKSAFPAFVYVVARVVSP